MKGKRRRMIFWIIIPAAVILMLLFFLWQNNSIVVSETDYFNEEIPEAFDGFKIVQVSDLHNKDFGDSDNRLTGKIKELSPDIIVITGDLIDRRRYDLDTAMKFIAQAVDIAPVYYVSGNHEAWSGHYEDVIEALEGAGIHVLENCSISLKKGHNGGNLDGESPTTEETIEIVGIGEPAVKSDIIKSLDLEGEDFKIVLCHRPELFDIYVSAGADLVFTGHAHGGQFRLPAMGGLIAPDQGFFPKYTSGSYTEGGTTMFVSRGLGNSIVPVRIFNRPEIVAVTLKSNG